MSGLPKKEAWSAEAVIKSIFAALLYSMVGIGAFIAYKFYSSPPNSNIEEKIENKSTPPKNQTHIKNLTPPKTPNQQKEKTLSR